MQIRVIEENGESYPRSPILLDLDANSKQQKLNFQEPNYHVASRKSGSVIQAVALGELSDVENSFQTKMLKIKIES